MLGERTTNRLGFFLPIKHIPLSAHISAIVTHLLISHTSTNTLLIFTAYCPEFPGKITVTDWITLHSESLPALQHSTQYTVQLVTSRHSLLSQIRHRRTIGTRPGLPLWNCLRSGSARNQFHWRGRVWPSSDMHFQSWLIILQIVPLHLSMALIFCQTDC